MKKVVSLVLATVLILALAACSSANGGGGETTDRAGNPITVPAKVEKIVSLSPAFTVILSDLGMGDKIVAMDSYSAFGFEGDTEGILLLDMSAPDLEQLAALQPDIVFVSNISSGGGSDVFKPLRDANICIAEIPTPDTVQGVLEDVAFIASSVGAKAEGEKLVNQAKEKLKKAEDLLKTTEQRPLVYFEIAPAPTLYTTGSGTYLDELITLAGGTNIFADQTSWAQVTEESVLLANPDVILTGVNYIDEPVSEILSRPGWEVTAAVENEKVYYIPPEISQQPTHHVVDGLLLMLEKIHPELVD